jgi:CheY-specific phosphatase CheX
MPPMPANELEQLLTDAATEVLETMFFATVTGEPAPDASAAPWISAGLAFQGWRAGRFGVRTPLETTRQLTASFLGLDEDALSEAQTSEVICELANMVCGSALSRLDGGARFDLQHPELNPLEPVGEEDSRVARTTLATQDGVLAFWLELE